MAEWNEGSPTRKRQCGKPGCPKKVTSDKLACREHWGALPEDLRGRINAAYRSGDRVAYRRALVDVMGVWRRLDPVGFNGRQVLRGHLVINQVQCPRCGNWLDLAQSQYLGREPIFDLECGYREVVNLSLYLALPTPSG